MIRFYAPDIEATGELPSDESTHCARVLRHRAGDEVYVVDGKGSVFTCRVTDDNPRRVKVEIISKYQELPHWGRNITLAVAPTKNADRMEWLVEKATEMGVDRVVLLRCEHSERRVLKTDRLKRVMAGAMKQSLKAQLPIIEGPVDINSFITSLPADSCRWIAHCESDRERHALMGNMPMPGQDVVILIGPEGDFSPQEIDLALQYGFTPVTMGASRLRTETAAMFALAALHAVTDKP